MLEYLHVIPSATRREDDGCAKCKFTEHTHRHHIGYIQRDTRSDASGKGVNQFKNQFDASARCFG
jgi:hypothetical protein